MRLGVRHFPPGCHLPLGGDEYCCTEKAGARSDQGILVDDAGGGQVIIVALVLWIELCGHLQSGLAIERAGKDRCVV